MSDVARELNISLTTVSFILSGKAKEMRISDALADRVLEFVKERNYNPNAMAQGLRTGKSKVIALIVEDIADPFFSAIAGLIEEQAHNKGYKIIYCSTRNSARKTAEIIQMLKNRNVDGYIISPPSVSVENAIKSLLLDKLPVVMLDSYLSGVYTDYVVVDNAKGVKLAITHLIQQGHKDIAFITLDSTQTQMADRLTGYKEAVAEAGLTEYVQKLSFDNDPQELVSQICTFLTYYKQLDAIMFATNYLTLRGFEAIEQLKLKISENIAVASFGDHDFFKVFNPPITAVSQPVKELSETLINILFKRINNEEPPDYKQQIVLEPGLAVRKSSLRHKQ